MKALLRLYPSRWQRRYRAEMEALLEELPRTPRVAVDREGSLMAHMDADPATSSVLSDGGPMTTGRPAPGASEVHALLTLRNAVAVALLLLSAVLLLLAAAQTAVIIDGFLRFGVVPVWSQMSERALIYAIPGLVIGAVAMKAFRRPTERGRRES